MDNGELEREARDEIERAKRHLAKTGSPRRDILKRLINLTHSPYPNLKILAAQNIRFFFNDFPELEEEAINAVYDLCEDQTAKVRIEGYTAVTYLSKADHRLVRRNADVLLQLLQSDEPDEVRIVKDALSEHLNIDAKVTFGVLCDQIAPLEDSMDEEEQDIRDRLRKCVLNFLTEDARKTIVERHALPSSDAEETLVESLLTVIPKLAYKDVEIIVEELLLKLKAFRTLSPSPRGSELLRALLVKVVEWVQKATRNEHGRSLRSAQPYLDLAGFVVIEKRIAPAIHLLRAYFSSISTKLNLEKFHPDDQQSVVCRLAETFAAANEQSSFFNDGDPPLDIMARGIVDSCPFLLEALHLSAASSSRHIKACIILLQACKRRKENDNWTPSQNLVAAFTDVQAKISRQESQDIHNLIRSLVPPPSTSRSIQDQKQTLSAVSTSQSTLNGKALPASLPERPVSAYPSRRMHIASSSRTQGQNMTRDSLTSHGSQSISIKHQLAPESASRPLKRQKSDVDDTSELDIGPSLLSRMGSNLPSTPTTRTGLASTTHPRTAAQKPHVVSALEHLPPQGEISIRGAANTSGRNAAKPQRAQTSSFSLLERLDNSMASVKDGKSGQWSRSSGR